MVNPKPLDTLLEICKVNKLEAMQIEPNWVDLKRRLDANPAPQNFVEKLGNLAWSMSPALAVVTVISGLWLYELSAQLNSQFLVASVYWQSCFELLGKVV